MMRHVRIMSAEVYTTLHHPPKETEMNPLKQILSSASIVFTTMALACVPAVAASTWPSKPVRLIVPYPPGGGTDIVARLLSTELTKQLGQNVIIENRGGGNTIIGTGALSQAAPDGYTVGLITDSHVINPHIMKSLPYDTKSDFMAVSQLVDVPFVMVASRSLDVNTIDELVKKAKAEPGKINYASIGNGSPHYLAMEWFADVADIDIAHIPYTGVAPALTDIAGNQVELMFTGLSSGLPHVADGRMMALAVSSRDRSQSAPDVPTIAESGFPEFSFVTWYGIVAPKDTPVDIVDRLSKEIRTALSQPALKDRLTSLGVMAAPSSPAEFADFIEKSATQYEQIFAITNDANDASEKSASGGH